MEDTQKAFEELERELEDGTLEKLLEDNKPAFEDPEKPDAPIADVEYNNYLNNYGRDEMPKAKSRTEQRKNQIEEKRRKDQILMALMITASVLCLGIIGVMIYWLEHFFG